MNFFTELKRRNVLQGRGALYAAARDGLLVQVDRRRFFPSLMFRTG